METLCFYVRNTVFLCRKHSVSMLMTRKITYISQVMCHVFCGMYSFVRA